MTRQTYGKKIPGLDLRTLKGRLVVIEGADGAGRSTQIALLRELLEREGFPVTHVGLKRSKLVSDELTEAMGTTMLCARTLLLLYATDFVDQLEQAVIPSLRAGFVVISDRYIYTLMARAIARGVEEEWIKGLYEIALRPDLVFSLRVSPRVLAERNLLKKRMVDYWESGQDIESRGNLYDGFIRYQKEIQKIFKRFEREYSLVPVNGERDPLEVHREIGSQVLQLLR